MVKASYLRENDNCFIIMVKGKKQIKYIFFKISTTTKAHDYGNI